MLFWVNTVNDIFTGYCFTLLFFRLGQSSLSSWDEAWYGAIAKNIIASKNIWLLSFNSHPYYDHPPAGFWFQAISLKLFGFSELAVRLPAVLAGIGSLIILYLLGKDLFNRRVGILSALALATAPWFLLRARSGNLDVPLTFFFILSFYLAYFSIRNHKVLYLLAISLAFLFLTKSLVPFTIIPSLVLIFWKKIQLKEFIKPIFLFLVLVMPWFVINQLSDSSLFNQYFKIGFPGVNLKQSFWENILLTKTYLHNGIGNWFLYGFISILLTPVFYWRKFFPIVLFIIIFMLPFAFSSKGQIWHLIPVYPFWILLFFGLVDEIMSRIRLSNFLSILIMVLSFFIIGKKQIIRNWYEIVNVSIYVSDEEILSTEAGKYPEPLYIDGDFFPAAVYYSNKAVIQVNAEEVNSFKNRKTPFLLISYDRNFPEALIKNQNLELIKKDRDKVLIRKGI